MNFWRQREKRPQTSAPRPFGLPTNISRYRPDIIAAFDEALESYTPDLLMDPNASFEEPYEDELLEAAGG